MDAMTVLDDGETASIQISAESRLADFERTKLIDTRESDKQRKGIQ